MPTPGTTTTRATRSTTPKAKPKRRRRHRSNRISRYDRRYAAGIAAFAGVLLLVLSGPRVVSDVVFAPDSPVLEMIDSEIGSSPSFAARGRSVGHDSALSFELEVLGEKIDRYERALRWDDDPGDRMILGRFYFHAGRLAERLENPELARILFRNSAANLRLALAADPARPYEWTQLVTAMSATDESLSQLSDVLARSINAAPYSADLIVPRIHIGFNRWHYLDEKTKDLVRRQVKIAAFLYPTKLAQAIRTNRDLYLSRFILEPYPPLLGRLEVALTGRNPDQRRR